MNIAITLLRALGFASALLLFPAGIFSFWVRLTLGAAVFCALAGREEVIAGMASFPSAIDALGYQVGLANFAQGVAVGLSLATPVWLTWFISQFMSSNLTGRNELDASSHHRALRNGIFLLLTVLGLSTDFGAERLSDLLGTAVELLSTSFPADGHFALFLIAQIGHAFLAASLFLIPWFVMLWSVDVIVLLFERYLPGSIGNEQALALKIPLLLICLALSLGHLRSVLNTELDSGIHLEAR